MRPYRYLLWPLLALFLTGCASQNVDWDYNPSHSLSGLKTYAWMDNKELVEKKGYNINSLTDERVHSAVDGILQTKSLKQVDQAAQADVLVTYDITVKTRREEHQVTTSVGWGYNAWGLGFSNDHYVNDYEEGSLIIDFVDPKTQKVLWRGVSRSRIRNKMTPEERIQQINKGVQQILSGFPRP